MARRRAHRIGVDRTHRAPPHRTHSTNDSGTDSTHDIGTDSTLHTDHGVNTPEDETLVAEIPRRGVTLMTSDATSTRHRHRAVRTRHPNSPSELAVRTRHPNWLSELALIRYELDQSSPPNGEPPGPAARGFSFARGLPATRATPAPQPPH
ncbi:hypothetical protein [Yinghuangia sp. YIM S09857]|uniref:hypothetical protein n=1 Tax=Yinghuangia sp. YIM S09857 TaxID=3436929 RepID=UPI003F531666